MSSAAVLILNTFLMLSVGKKAIVVIQVYLDLYFYEPKKSFFKCIECSNTKHNHDILQ